MDYFILIFAIYGIIWFILKRVLLKSLKCQRTLHGKTVIVTGANCGIGKATTQELVKLHARVIMACRNTSKAKQAVCDIRKITKNGELVIKELDLMSLKSVRKFAKEVLNEENNIDILINNAGVFNHPYMLTEDKLEVHMAVNHFSNFLLTNLFLERMISSKPSRIIFVNSFFYKSGSFNKNDINMDFMNSKQFFKYANSKLANAYFARELDKRIKDFGVSVYTVDPGMVHTQISRHTTPAWFELLLTPVSWLIKTPLEGCRTVLYCAISEELDGVSGNFYRNCAREDWSKVCSDDDISRKLWDLSEVATRLNDLRDNNNRGLNQ